ncbi:MFS transporter [Candidatus Bathyarchaeota archaeon]|nr:MFS transporter [Candidatus Bathyarchaeota archaeon]
MIRPNEGTETKANEPQQSTRKSIFLNLSLFQFLSFVRRGIFYTFMINYLFNLMQTVTYTALLGTLNMMASALGQNLLWGRISDRYKFKTRLIVAGESIAAVSYLAVFLVHRSLLDSHAGFAAGVSLIIGLSFLEFFWSMSDVGWASLLTDMTTSKTRGGIVGVLNFIASLGRMIGIIFAGLLYNDGEGFRQGTIFYIVIVMLAASTLLMWITSRSTEKPVGRTEEKAAKVASAKTSASYDGKTYKWFLASLIMLIVGAACVSQVFLLFIKLPEGLNASDAEMSLILTTWTLGGMLASLLCGWLADRIGKVKVILVGSVLAFLTPLLYGSASSIPTMALVYGFNGISFWTIQTVGFALAGDLIPEDRRGRLFSRYNTVMALSWGPAGLLVGGPLADIQTKSLGLSPYTAYVNAFFASSIIVTLGAILFAAKVARPKAKTA